MTNLDTCHACHRAIPDPGSADWVDDFHCIAGPLRNRREFRELVAKVERLRVRLSFRVECEHREMMSKYRAEHLLKKAEGENETLRARVAELEVES